MSRSSILTFPTVQVDDDLESLLESSHSDNSFPVYEEIALPDRSLKKKILIIALVLMALWILGLGIYALKKF